MAINGYNGFWRYNYGYNFGYNDGYNYGYNYGIRTSISYGTPPVVCFIQQFHPSPGTNSARVQRWLCFMWESQCHKLLGGSSHES